MSATYFIILLLAIILGFVVVATTLKKRGEKPEEQSGFLLIQNQLQAMDAKLENKLEQVTTKSQSTMSDVTKTIQTQFGQSAKIIGDVTEKLTRLDETNKQVITFTEQLKKLQDTLTNPKQRGVLGEYYLETILRDVLPPGTYQMQYPLPGGVIVDAAVFVNNYIIPIDSKFSLENYNRAQQTSDPTEKKKYESLFVNDIKSRIDETSKYVMPEAHTTNYAFMFIPSEAIWYDLLVNKVGSTSEDKNLIAYAYQKHVTIVSPSSFLAHLQTVLQGINNQKISDEAEDIIKQVANLGKHLTAYQDYFQKVGKNLGTTVGAYNNASKEFGKIDKDIFKISAEKIDAEPLTLPKPETEEAD